jgi:anti-sigma factor RsiW
MDCQPTTELLNGYLDGELDLVRALEVERHLQDCAACARIHARRLDLRNEMESAALYHPAPAALETRLRAALRGVDAASPAERSIAWRKFALVGSIAASLLMTWTLATRSKPPAHDDLLAHDVLASHVRSLLADHLSDVASSDQHTVKPWFNGLLDFSPWVGDLGDEGFPLMGGRLDYLDGRSVAALVYKRRKHVINLFVWPAPDGDSLTKAGRINGFHYLHWKAEGMNWWAISDLNANELDDFGQLARLRAAKANAP